MNTHTSRWVLALAMLVGLFLVPVKQVSAQVAGSLPQTKEPSSARFDITGQMTISGSGLPSALTFNIAGNGAIAGGNMQQDFTITAPPELASGGTETITVSTVLVGNRLYIKAATGMPGEQEKWYYSDLPPGSTTGSAGLTGLDPKYAAAYRTTEAGKETINGAATTKYQIDVDVAKLLELSGEGLGDPETAEILRNTRMVFWLWVGDTDMYVHQLRLTMELRTQGDAQGSDVALAMDLTYTFKEFDVPVTITAPEGAEPLPAEMSGIAMTSPTGIFTSMTSAMGTQSGAGTTSAMPTGMPRTGFGDQTFPLYLLIISLLCLAAGATLKRKLVR